MGFAWIIGFIALVTAVTVLWFLFTIFGALQGVFIFTSFAFNSRVREMWRKKLQPKKDVAVTAGRSVGGKSVNTVTEGTTSTSV